MLGNSKNLELKKHVGTIHSSGCMSLLQRKIANGLLYNAYNELLVKEEHQISVKDLCMLIGYDSHDVKVVKKALINLLSTVVEWNLVDKDSVDKKDGTWNASSIIADASINGAICLYSYSNKMKKLLYHPSVYGRLNMSIQAKFKSGYGLALYENCIRYQNLKSTQWFDLQTFRKLMGVGDGSYVVFSEFKKRVLNIAVKEVNAHSPILITPEVRKKCNSVISIRFLIDRKSNDAENTLYIENHRDVSNENDRELIRCKLRNNFGMSNNQVENIISKYDDQYITSKIDLVTSSSSFTGGKIKNLAKYLSDALDKDYQHPKSSAEIAKKIDVECHRNDEKKYLKEIFARRQEALVSKYDKYVRLRIIDNFKKLGKDQQDLVLQEFFAFDETDKEIISLYNQRGFSSSVVAFKFISFVKKQKTELLSNILSFENYCNNEKQ